MNKQKLLQRIVSAVFGLLLIAASAVTLTGCTQSETPPTGGSTTTATVHTPPTTDPAAPIAVGVGETVFTFTVEYGGTTTVYEVSTDEATVGQTLQNLGLIEGEEGPFGLYVKTVDGITLDYTKDGKYWSFYVNGAYATGGVDTTAVQAGAAYTFKAEAA